MNKPSQFRNPFYVVLLVIGVMFVITACGYAVLSVRGVSPSEQVEPMSPAGEQLIEFLDKHGFTTLMVELALLGVATFAAIATDQYWEKE